MILEQNENTVINANFFATVACLKASLGVVKQWEAVIILIG